MNKWDMASKYIFIYQHSLILQIEQKYLCIVLYIATYQSVLNNRHVVCKLLYFFFYKCPNSSFVEHKTKQKGMNYASNELKGLAQLSCNHLEICRKKNNDLVR